MPSPYRYAYEIAFVYNDNQPYGTYALKRGRYRKRADAEQAARNADGCGRACGAYARRVRVTPADYELARTHAD